MTFVPVDGKYCTYNYLLQYVQGQRTDPNNPNVFNGFVTGTPDQEILDDCLLQAESSFELEASSGFDQQTYALTQAFAPFVDGDGWLWAFARERGPVTAVTAVQVLDKWGGSTTWQAATLDSNLTILPTYFSSDTHPRPDSWRVMLRLSNFISPRAQGQVLVKWSYTGGFAVIPLALTNLIARMATWMYKFREAPMGKVMTLPLGTTVVPLQYPPDLLKQISQWRPVYD